MVLGRELIADVEDIENDFLLETIDGVNLHCKTINGKNNKSVQIKYCW